MGDFVQEGHLPDTVWEKVTKSTYFVTPWTFENHDFALKVLQNRYFHPSQKSSAKCPKLAPQLHQNAPIGKRWGPKGSPGEAQGGPGAAQGVPRRGPRTHLEGAGGPKGAQGMRRGVQGQPGGAQEGSRGSQRGAQAGPGGAQGVPKRGRRGAQGRSRGDPVRMKSMRPSPNSLTFNAPANCPPRYVGIFSAARVWTNCTTLS